VVVAVVAVAHDVAGLQRPGQQDRAGVARTVLFGDERPVAPNLQGDEFSASGCSRAITMLALAGLVSTSAA
jgi:hypothetical protein